MKHSEDRVRADQVTEEVNPPPITDATLITVCDKCLRACCWLGEFMCDDARDAGITTRTVAQCRELGEEHSEYWPRSVAPEAVR